jgi:hypothetical protein
MMGQVWTRIFKRKESMILIIGMLLYHDIIFINVSIFQYQFITFAHTKTILNQCRFNTKFTERVVQNYINMRVSIISVLNLI